MMMMSSSPPKSPEESDRSKKYDRQIRLWGEHGQTLVEAAKICLVNASAVGCELLKGLVLPGIGGFTIADGSMVTEEDLGANFFLDTSCIGESKASACKRLLQELNPDTNGDFVDESIEYILANRPVFFETFDVVVATNLNERTLLELSNTLWEANIPFIYCRSLGFYGLIRLQVKEHCVVETHPDNRHNDLRLEHPFPILRNHFENTEVTRKVPWLLVLNKYLQEWKGNNDGRIPTTYAEKTDLRNRIRSSMTADEENYLDAIKAVNTAFGGGIVTQSIKAIFDDTACFNLTKQSNTFWIMVKALKEFVEVDNNGLLPLAGVLPDMTAETECYINLQNVYRQQALLDADNVYRKCLAILKELGLPDDTINEQAVRLFCREASGLDVVRGTRISDAYAHNSHFNSFVDESEVQGSFTELYVALRSFERFLSECGNTPGEYLVENDTASLKSISNKTLADWGGHAYISDDIIHEICRYGGSELHTISAFVGGCAAQEVIKIITKQYMPINNTFLYNGIKSETQTIKL